MIDEFSNLFVRLGDFRPTLLKFLTLLGELLVLIERLFVNMSKLCESSVRLRERFVERHRRFAAKAIKGVCRQRTKLANFLL